MQRIEQREDVSKGGIIIPDVAQEVPQEGFVKAVGPGKLRDDGSRVPMNLRPGARVLFGKYTGSEIQLGGESYLIMREGEVLSELEEVQQIAKQAETPPKRNPRRK